MEYIIGADVGTTSTRVIVCDRKGNIISEGRSAYQLIRPKPGWVEQKAEWWYEAFCNASKEALEKTKIDIKQIKACGITHQRQSFVPVDKDLNTLRNGILWNDMRCGDQAEQACRKLGRTKIYRRTGFPPSTMTLYKIMWIRDNEPGIYEKTHKFLLVTDYVIARLTGDVSTVQGTATFGGALDIEKKNQWAFDILEGLNVDYSKLPEKIFAGGEILGRITEKASSDTGIPEGLPIIATGGDQPVGVLGVGIVKPGMAGINGGTSCTIQMYSEDLPIDPEITYLIEISPEGGYAPEGAIYSGASALMIWYRDNFGGEEIREAKKNKKNTWEVIYNKAKEVPAGSIGLMTLPYFAGASGPYWDVRGRGVITGLLENHNRSHLIRSIIEGQAYESRRIIEAMEKVTSIKLEEIRMYGGSSVSDIFNQIFSDVLNIPVVTTGTSEATALGAAICAAKGGGIYKDFNEAVDNMVKINKRFEPDKKNSGLYDELYNDVYRNIYDRLSDLMHKTSLITKVP
jgi:xylulokinase